MTSKSVPLSFGCVLALLSAFSFASPAFALGAQSAAGLTGTDEEARARLIEDAKKAHGGGRHDEALGLVKRAAALKLTPSLRYFLAYEQEEVGSFAEAYANAKKCAAEFDSDTALPQRSTYLPLCLRMRDRLAGKVAYVIVVVPRAAPGIAVTLDGAVIKPELFGVPYLVSAGSISIHATAPDHESRHVVVWAAPGQSVPVELNLSPNPENTSSAPPSNTAGYSVPPSPGPALTQPAPPPQAVPNGVGLSGLAAGMYFPLEGGGSTLFALEAGVRLRNERAELRLHILGGHFSADFEDDRERTSGNAILAGVSAAPLFYPASWIGFGAHGSGILSFGETRTFYKEAAGYLKGMTSQQTGTVPTLNLLFLMSLRPSGPSALFDFGIAVGPSMVFDPINETQVNGPSDDSGAGVDVLAFLWLAIHP